MNVPARRHRYNVSRRRRNIGAIGTTLFASLLAVAPTLNAQVLTGEIDGTVRDSTGAVIPNATVTVTNSDQNLVKRTVKTDALGQFTAPLLAVGGYSLTISATGFETDTITGVQVHVGQPSAIPVQLATGSVSEAVTVSAETVSTQLDSPAAGTLIDSTQTTELPLSSRNFLQLLFIQPGISSSVPGPDPRGNILPTGAVNTQNFSVNGGTTAANGYFLDGADTIKRAGQQPVTFTGPDFVQEINLQRANFGAEFGGSGAAYTSVQTKAGGTSFHGSLFGFFQSQVLEANTYLDKAVTPIIPRGGLRYADFGYEVQGPVFIPKVTGQKSAKTFFSFGQEYLRSASTQQIVTTNIPTAAQRTGTFAVPVCTVYTGTKCTTTATSIKAFDPTAQAYLTDIISKLPLPNNPTDPQGLIAQETGIENETQTFIRIDHQFSDKLSVFFRYLDDPFNLVVPFGFQQTSNIPGIATSTITDGSTNWLGHVTYVINANHVVEGGFATRSNWVTAQSIGLLQPSNSPDIHVQLPYANTLGQVPHFSINGTADGSAYSVTGPYNERAPVQQIFLNSTNTLGRHTILLGTNIEIQSGGSNNGVANAGNFAFAAGTLPTGGTAFSQSFANFLLGRPSTFTQTSVDASGANQTNIYEGYIQDDFHASPRLTLNGGVRYTYFASAVSANIPGLRVAPVVNFDPKTYSAATAPTIDSSGLICTTSPCAGGKTPNPNYNSLNGIIIGGQNSPFGQPVYTAPNKTFAPRVGFTYDVNGNGKTAIRGGYGIYYLPLTGNQSKFATNQDKPNVQTTTISSPAFGNPGNGTPVLSAAPTVLQALQVNGPAPYSEQYSLDVQREVGSGTVFDVGYYGNTGVHLYATIDENQIPAGLYASSGLIAPGGVTTGNTQTLNQFRPYAGYSAITTQNDSFSSNYNSLQTSLRQRVTGGGTVTASYTYSKALTDANTPQNSVNLASEYGPTTFNRKHVFNSSFVYPLPFYRNENGVVGHVLGGFEVSGIVSYGSGRLFTATTANLDPGGLGLLVGPATGRPNYVSNPNAGAPHTFAKWFNTKAFTPDAAAGDGGATIFPAGQTTPGTESVNNIQGPGYGNWDVSLYKNVKLESGVNFQLRAEAFNVFNHTNFTTFGTVATSTNFGDITATGQNRNLQLGAKLTF